MPIKSYYSIISQLCECMSCVVYINTTLFPYLHFFLVTLSVIDSEIKFENTCLLVAICKRMHRSAKFQTPPNAVDLL